MVKNSANATPRNGKRHSGADNSVEDAKHSGAKNPRCVKPSICTPSPLVPPKENSEFLMIQLPNGIKALLISTKENKDPNWTLTFPDMTSTGAGAQFTGNPSYMTPVRSELRCAGPHPSDDRRGCLCPTGNNPKPKCMASIMLATGAFQDPLKFQGLAHFCEHVVHLGSELYPGEDDIRTFISDNQGSSNAFTDKNMTNYHFQVNSSPKILTQALNMYGDMLRAPLFPMEAITREVESVDNEYYLRRIYHSFQRSQLLNSVAITGDHPMKQFMIGSKETLLPKGKASAEDLRNAVKAFHAKYYYAENMRLVVRSPESLEFMRNCVENAFSGISKLGSCSGKDAGGPRKGIPYDMTAFNRLYTVKPRCNDGHELYLSWALPAAAWQDYKTKPLDYIGSVLSHDGSGGLANHLRAKGWCLDMYAGCMDHGTTRNEFVSLFEVIVIMTQEGRDRVSDVIEAIFGFIKLHQKNGVQEQVWDEFKRIQQVKFEAMKLGSSVNDTASLSRAMHLFSDEQVITGGSLLFQFNAKKINEYLNLLTPSKANFMLFTLDTGRTVYLTEKFYQTEYLVQDLGDCLAKFENASYKHLGFNPKCWLNPNATLPTVQINDICAVNEITAMSPKVTVLYAPIREMVSPQANFLVSITSAMNVERLLAERCLLDVWQNMIKIMSIPDVSNQVNFGTKFGIGVQNASFLFQLIGLNNGMADLLIYLLERFDKFEQEATPDGFRVAKELVLHSYYATSVQTRELASDFLCRLIYLGKLTNYESHEMLEKVSFPQLMAFVRDFKERMHFACKVSGMVYRNDVVRVGYALEAIQTQPLETFLTGSPLPTLTKKSVSLGERCLRVKAIQPKERLTAVMNYYELAPTCPETVAIVTLLHTETARNPERLTKPLRSLTMIQRKLFHQLRTMEQLGYDVNSTLVVDSAKTGFIVYVVTHADKHSPCYIDGRIENFLSSFYQELKPDQLTPLLKKCQIIRDPEYVQMFFTKYFLKGGIQSGFKKLSVQVVGCRGEPCLCQKYVQGTAECREATWLDPVGAIGKEKTPIRFAGKNGDGLGGFGGDGSQEPSAAYFIRSIPEYHSTG